MCITYKVDAPENICGALELRMNSNVITLDSNLKSTGGEYVISAPTERPQSLIPTNGMT